MTWPGCHACVSASELAQHVNWNCSKLTATVGLDGEHPTTTDAAGALIAKTFLVSRIGKQYGCCADEATKCEGITTPPQARMRQCLLDTGASRSDGSAMSARNPISDRLAANGQENSG